MGAIIMAKNRAFSRRSFLKGGAFAAAGVAAAPYIIPSSALGLDDVAAPSNRVIYGYVGCGNHGMGWNFDQVFRCPDAQIIAVCDLDQNHLAEAKAKVDAHYGEKIGKDYKSCATYEDFRELINRNDLDAVGVATPDHWHVIPAIMAAMSGKDVICEKPLTLTVAEGRLLCDAVKRADRVFQTASENRSIETYIRLIELVRGGVVGKLKHIEVRLPIGNTSMRVGAEGKDFFDMQEVTDPPKTLNFEMWLGQAPVMPYVPAYVHGNYRWNLAFSGGVLTDWGAHMVDLAQLGYDTERTGPVGVEGKGDFPPRDAVHNAAPTFDIHYEYADGVTMRVSAGEGDLDPKQRHEGPVVGRTPQPGIRFEGSDGWIESHAWRGTLKASKRSMLDVKIDPEKAPIYRPSEIVPRASDIGGEHRNFVDCVKSRKPCYAPAETGHRTITIPHIGNIAMQLGRKLCWNPETERFVNDAEADAMLSRKQREPWTIANVEKWIEKNS
jgi:predicted dehydrogenase